MNLLESIDNLTEIIARNPDDAEAYKERGKAYQILEEHALAIQDFTQAIKLSPNIYDEGSYYLRGISYDNLADDEDWDWDLINDNFAVFKDFDKAIELNSSLTGLYFERGLHFKNLKDYLRAMAYFGKAIKYNQDDIEIYKNLAESCFEFGRYDLAAEYYSCAIDLNPNDAELYRRRGEVFKYSDEADWAKEDFDKAAELEKDS